MAQTVISRGFGLLQRIITRGFFSSAAPSPDCILAFNGKIQESVGYQGLIDDTSTAVVGLINDEATAVYGTIYPQAAFTGEITDREGYVGEVTDKAGFKGVICEC